MEKGAVNTGQTGEVIMNDDSDEHSTADTAHWAANDPGHNQDASVGSQPTEFASDHEDVVAGSYHPNIELDATGVEEYGTQPVWETAPADDLNAALAYAQHLVDAPYDHPALQGLSGLQGTIDQIAGPQAIAGVLGAPYTPGETLTDLTWQQLGLTGFQDLQGFIDAQYGYVDQLATAYDPGISAPLPGYEQFYGPLGLQTASGVELPTLGNNSWFGAPHPF
jgi:hypothetical protein